MKIFSHQATAYRQLLTRAQTFFAGHWRGLNLRCRWHSLIIGPTASGKTALASILAEETGAALLRINVTNWMPSGANNRAVAETLETIVSHINAYSRSILFLDEVDKIYHETPWMGYIRGELFEILDGRLPLGTKPPAFGEEDGEAQFPTEKSLSEKLRSTVFIVGAGTFQQFYETRRSPSIGFHHTEPESGTGPTADYIAQKLPRELATRFNSQLLFIPELSPIHYQALVHEAEKSLPDWLVPAFRQAATRRMAQAISVKSGCRFLEEAVMDALQITQPPHQPDEAPFALLEGAENPELECGL